MALIVTPGGTDSNSYATLAEANAYHDTRLHNAAWTGATDVTKEAALIWAARTLDANIYWYGLRAAEGQALDWPRYGVVDSDGYPIDSDVVPIQVKNAQSELAFLLIESDRTVSSDPDPDGVTEVKLGTGSQLAVKFSGKRLRAAIADSVFTLVQDLGEFLGAGTTSGTRVLRTART